MSVVHQRTTLPHAETLRAAVDEERAVGVLNRQPRDRLNVSSHKHSNIAQNPEGVHR